MPADTMQQRIREAQLQSVNNSSPVNKSLGIPMDGSGNPDGQFPVQQDPGDPQGGWPPPMQAVQQGAIPPQFMPQGGMTGPQPGQGGMAYGAPPQAPGGQHQQPQGYAPMPMAGAVQPGHSPEGMQMVNSGYAMGDSQQGGTPQQQQAQQQMQMQMPGGYMQMPGGYMMMGPGGQMMMQPMPGQPGQPMVAPNGMQFVMVQQGPNGQQQMMQLPQGQMPGQMPGGMPMGMNQDGSMVMMNGVPHQGMLDGKGQAMVPGGQVSPMDQSQDGKGGSRVAAGLGRNSQPKQGANWRDQQTAAGRGLGMRRPGGGGPQDFATGPYGQMDPQMMQQMAPMDQAMSMGVMPGQSMGMPPQMFPGQAQPKSTAPVPLPPNGGGATPSSPSGNRKPGASKMRTPENPWADMQDSHHDPAVDLAAMGWNKSGAFNQKGGGAPPSPAGKGKGRKDGKGMDDGKGSRGQDMQQSGWVPKSEVRQDKGKGQARQEQWAPKSMPAPKAPMPEPLSIASGKGGGRGGGAMPVSAVPSGGKKSKPGRRDGQLEDWLSQRFAGCPPSDLPDSAQDSRNEASEWDKDGGDYDDYDYEDGGGDSRRKRKGKGGKGKAAKADKGKGKGKSGRGGGVWRQT